MAREEVAAARGNALLPLLLCIVLLIGAVVLGAVLASGQGDSADERFGLAGSCVMAEDLNIPWAYDWGNGLHYPNEFLEDCRQANGRTGFYAVGMESSADVALEDFESQYLLTEEEQEQYQRLKAVVGKLPLYGGWAQAGFLLIPKYAEDAPGSHYQIGNEVDLVYHSSFYPADYAEYYNLFYNRIKQYDPTAKVMVGGLISFLPETPYNSSDPYAWIREFREEHKGEFGQYPQVDVWAIHPYVWQVDWQKAKGRIVGFKGFLDEIGEGTTPIWLTEFGLGNSEGELVRGQACAAHGCLSLEEQEEEYRLVAEELMMPLAEWLKTATYVKRWFWFYGGQEYPWNGVNNVGDIYKNPYGEYNPLGVTYMQLADVPGLVNTGFDSSTAEPYGWSFWAAGPGSDYALTIDTVEKRSGSGAARLEVGSQAGDAGHVAAAGQAMAQPDIGGKYVRLSLWTKTDSSGYASLKVNLGYADGSVNSYWGPSVVQPGQYPEWTEIGTGQLTIPDNVVEISVDALAYGQSGKVWFDDVSLEVSDEPFSSSPSQPCDLNDDGQVTMQDISLMVQDFGNSGSGLSADVNGDGAVNLFDLVMIARNMVSG